MATRSQHLPALEAIDANGDTTFAADDTRFEEQHVHFPFGVSEENDSRDPEVPPLRLEVVDDRSCLADYELVRRMRAAYAGMLS